MRRDNIGRDVTDLAGLWDESDWIDAATHEAALARIAEQETEIEVFLRPEIDRLQAELEAALRDIVDALGDRSSGIKTIAVRALAAEAAGGPDAPA